MNRKKTINTKNDSRTIDTKELQGILGCGRKTAVEIGTAAGARIQIGKRVLWNIRKVDEYLDKISK